MNSLSNLASTRAQNEMTETFAECVEQAEICCEHARIAGRQRRYKAACGLFSTALALYSRATNEEGATYGAVQSRLREVETEMAAYNELAKSMSRPMHPPSIQTSTSARTREVGRQNLWLEK